ncbi:MAG TPA: hypothetical protein VL307_04445 [Chitinophagaceae bacterium]|nr:hypothetical protein [Chitinophagaceae bacterium]
MAKPGLKVKRLKKQTRKQVTQELMGKLAGALDGYKATLGEKKFAKRIEKASKLFAVDLTKAMRKDIKAVKKEKEATPNL